MMHYGYGWYEGGMFFMMLIPLLLVGIIVYAAVRLSMRQPRHETGEYVSDNSMRILNERYASGEISDDEYQHKKALLQKR